LQVFIVGRLYLLALLGFLSFSCTAANTQISQVSTDPAASSRAFEMYDPKNFPQSDGMPSILAPSSKTLVMSLGPKLVELKASYLEKPEQPSASNTTTSPDGNLRRYLSLLATSSFAGTGLTGESELTYSPINSLLGQCACKEWPKMLRLGLKSRWEGLKYGADYRSTDRGFVSINGVAADQTRNEAQVWGEHSLGPFNIRGSIGESWEKPLDSNGLRVTRNATAALKFNRSQWGAQFVSSYEWIEQDTIQNQQTTAFTNTLTGSYRPFDVLSVNPNFSIKEERNPYTGIRTETPRTELIFAYTPFRDTKLTGATSFARSFGAEGLNTARGFGTTAAIDWRIGKFVGKEDFLSFNFNYNHQPDFISSANPQKDLSGTLQLRITGF
jgi:hypothetical protein